MHLGAAFTALSASAPLASRAFLPLFLVSAWAAFHEKIPGLPEISVPPALSWMTSPYWLGIIGILALLEIVADKNQDAKEFLDLLTTYAKPAAAILITLAILPPEAAALAAPLSAGIPGTGAVAAGSAGLTLYLARQRQRLMIAMMEIDDEDDLGFRFLISLLEDFWAFFGMLFFIILPIVTIILAVILSGLAFLLCRLLDYLENKDRYPCPKCQSQVLPTAVECYECHTDLAPPHRLSWSLWRRQRQEEGALEPTARREQMLRLLAGRRCPTCAEKAPPREIVGFACNTCGHDFAGQDYPGWFDDYRAAVHGRAKALFVPIFLLGFMPVVGFAVAVAMIRFLVAAPLRLLLSPVQRLKARWTVRLIGLVLLVPACIPLLSILAVPGLLLAHIFVYERLARRAAGLQFPEQEKA